MKYLPDSNVLIALLGGHEPLFARVQRQPRGDFGLSSIVAFELFFGALNGTRQAENMRRLGMLRLDAVGFEAQDALRAAEIRAALKSAGTPIGPYDTLIAGQALARDLILITRNTREFGRVEGLRVENWQDG